MTPIKTARIMRCMSQADLARAMGVSPQGINQYEAGARSLGPKLLPIAAKVLRVDAAYLRGDAQRLAVWDWLEQTTLSCQIISETDIDGYGAFYLVEVEDLGVIAVILADGVQFTLPDWQGDQPMDAEEIGEYSWVDAAGRCAVMLDGLPRMIWG